MRYINRPLRCSVAVLSILSVSAVAVTCHAQAHQTNALDVKREKAIALREERLKKRSPDLKPPTINSAKDGEAYIKKLGGRVIHNALDGNRPYWIKLSATDTV